MVEFMIEVVFIGHQEGLVEQGPLGGGGDGTPRQRWQSPYQQGDEPQFLAVGGHSPVHLGLHGTKGAFMVLPQKKKPSTPRGVSAVRWVEVDEITGNRANSAKIGFEG